MTDPSLPERRFKLSAAARAQMRHDIDLDALEQLLGSVPQEVRDLLQRAFAADLPTDFANNLPRDGDGSGMHGADRRTDRQRRREALLPFQPSDLIFEDPTLQAMLDAVLKPTRRTPPDIS
jgi:hypothetical protein